MEKGRLVRPFFLPRRTPPACFRNGLVGSLCRCSGLWQEYLSVLSEAPLFQPTPGCFMAWYLLPETREGASTADRGCGCRDTILERSGNHDQHYQGIHHV